LPGGRPAKRSARNRPPSAVPLKGYGLPAEKTLRGGPVVGGTTLSRRRPVRGSPLSSSSSGPSRSQPRPRSQVQLARQRADACANDRRICVSRLRGRSRGGGLLDDPQVSATPARSFRHFLCQTPSSFTGTPPVRLVAAHLSRLATPSPRGCRHDRPSSATRRAHLRPSLDLILVVKMPESVAVAHPDVHPDVCGSVTTSWPWSNDAVVEEAPHVHSCCAPAEPTQPATATSAATATAILAFMLSPPHSLRASVRRVPPEISHRDYTV
jgi:hypothetical protein